MSNNESNNNGGSSPLFYPSSSAAPSLDIRPGLSPLHYSSLVFNSDSQRPGDIRSDLTSDAARERFRRGNTRRGDLSSTDLPAGGSTSGRRYFNDIPSSSLPGLILNSDASDSTLRGNNDNEPVRVIWGTNVSIQECSNNFRDFLMLFKYKYRKQHDRENTEDDDYDIQDSDLHQEEDSDNELYYVKLLTEMRSVGATNLNLDARNLLSYRPTHKLYYQLINYPQEVIPIMDQAVKDCMISLATENNQNFSVEDIETNVYKIRPFNIESNSKGMRELNPGDIDKLVSIKGLVLRASTIIPDMKVAFFKCNTCDHTMSVEIDRGVIQEPSICPRCTTKENVEIVHNRSSFSDKQVIKLQETPETVPDGQTPHSVSLCVYDELVDSCRAGDRIEVCGIFRSVPIRMNSRQRSLKSLFKTYVDVVHIRKIHKKRLGVDVSTLDNVEQAINENLQQNVEEVRKITESEIDEIKNVSKRRDLYELLARSLAPSIYELDDLKKGILLQLFGGTNKKLAKGGSIRGDINVLLCGDPSTSKSQILQYVHKIAPRGIYTSGKGSSAVGLTAYVTRDVDTKQLVLESGALVLSDGGVCCIDEFDKMSDTTRSVLHEVMEQQTISIAKAGIITTLNARTSILASANPIGSRYNPDLPVTQNIDLPPPLLSRFDLVYLVLDKVDPSQDRQLAQHIALMYLEDAPSSAATKGDILPTEFLTLYISYAKQHIHPAITEGAKNELVRAYVGMRKLGEDVRALERRITATTRQLESMIRLAEAHAKMRLSLTVEVEDVLEAVRLIKSAIKDYATDPLTGKIDMDLVQTGRSATQRMMKEDLQKAVIAIIKSSNSASAGGLPFGELVKVLNDQSSAKVENLEVADVLGVLQAEGRVAVTGEGSRRMVRVIGV